MMEILEDRRLLTCVTEDASNDTHLTADVLTLSEDPAGSGPWSACGMGTIDLAVSGDSWSDPD